MKKLKQYRTYLAILLLLLAIAFVSTINWKHLVNLGFKPQSQASEVNSDAGYKISVFYFPSRENAAKAVTYYFTQQGLLIEMLPAQSLEGLDAFRYSANRMFFNTEELSKAMSIKKSIETVLGYPLNAYRFQVSQSSPSMMIVFTEGGS